MILKLVPGWKVCGIYNMMQVNLMLIDLDIVKQILTKDFSNFMDRGMYTNEKSDPLSKDTKFIIIITFRLTMQPLPQLVISSTLVE